MRYVAIFFLGIILGAGLTNLLLARQLEQLHLARTDLEQRLATTREELSQLKENLAKQSYQVVTAIEPVISFSGEKPPAVEGRAVIQALIEEVQAILAPLKGQEVRRLNPALIPVMIDGRTVRVNGRWFHLQVTLVLISDTVIVHIQARGMPAGSSL